MLAGSVLASVGFGFVALSVPYQAFTTAFYAVLAVMGLLGVGESMRRLVRQRALAFELKRGQHAGTYEVEVTLTPRSSVRVTAVRATLRCVSSSANAVEPMSPTVSNEFAVAEELFEGSARLGHGECLSSKASLALPPTARPSSPAGADPSIHYELSVRVDVDGMLFLEHDERVKIVAPQVTLSQM